MSISSTEERPAATSSGFIYIGIGLVVLLIAIGLMAMRPMGPTIAFLVAAVLLAFWCLGGLYMLQPNQAALLLLFGSYRGTDRERGLRWANPFYSKTKISVRAHNFNSEKLKVNDARGNPIEIAATVVWRVDDTARASFDVENYEAYVLTHLAYAPEIAGTMLRRQQAEAVIAARTKIVQGAVGMVELALNGLAERGLLQLDDERKAAMVSNLLVVLCSDHDATPVVNAGTLYN